MTFEDSLFNTFICIGFLCSLPFLMAIGIIAYPIVVAVWLNNYIENRD